MCPFEVDPSVAATDAPLIRSVEFTCYLSDEGGWMSMLWGPGRMLHGCLPAGAEGFGMSDGPWFRCLEEEREVAVILAVPDRDRVDDPEPGRVIAPDFGELQIERPVLGARIKAASPDWPEN